MSRHLTRVLIITMSALLMSGCLSLGKQSKTATTSVVDTGKYLYYLKKGDIAPMAGWLVDDEDIKMLYRESTR